MAIVKKAMRAIQRLGHKVVNMPNDVDAAVRTEPATNDYPRLKAEGDLYASQTAELTAHNHALTEAVTKYRSQVQELERELLAARTEIAMYPRLKAEHDFYASQTEELTAHNRLLRTRTSRPPRITCFMCARPRRNPILVFRFPTRSTGEGDFLFKILDFYGISRELFRRPEIEKDDDLHFRVGQEEEWQVRFTPGQLARTRDMIDSELLERFGWPR